MKFEIEEVNKLYPEDREEMDELLEEYEAEYDPDIYLVAEDDHWDKETENTNKKETLEKIIINDDTKFVLSLSVLKDGVKYNIVNSFEIEEEMLIEILKNIDYGNWNWEQYELVRERNILDDRF